MAVAPLPPLLLLPAAAVVVVAMQVVEEGLGVVVVMYKAHGAFLR